MNRQTIVGNKEALCRGARWCYRIARQPALQFYWAVIKLCQVIIQVARCVSDVFCMACCVGSGLGYV